MRCPTCGTDSGDSSRYCPSCGSTLVRNSPEGDEYIGKTLAKKYRVEALIGEGGMGKVYKARQLALEKAVVLKVLRQSLLSDERTVARFQREAKAASRLNHPNSIGILDFGQAEDGALFIAMEFIAGQDLHQILSREWPLSEARVVRIVSQVLSALSDAHGAGVIHRDLKPENIMVEQRRNEPDFVKVLDFGIAKITDTNGDDGPALTRAGFVCGTPEYMSPEQARGSLIDHRSDLYAVGVILYQLMTGLLPFESDSAVGFATKHLTEEPLPPTRRRPEARISPAMERLIVRALSKDPNDRPANAEAFKSELLAVDRERRRTEASTRRAPVTQPPLPSTPVLAPLPRRATPGSALATMPGTDPGWGPNERTQEATVRAEPELMKTVQNPVPIRPITSERTEAIVPAVEDEGGGFGFFKALTITLLLAASAIAAYYYYSISNTGALLEETYPNAPVPGRLGAGPDLSKPLYEQDIPIQNRNAQKAREAELEGDRQVERGFLGMAATEYKKAFGFDPRPDLSLKLGEVYLQNNKIEEAKNWWARHLRDAPGSKAAAYIDQTLKTATSMPMPPQ